VLLYPLVGDSSLMGCIVRLGHWLCVLDIGKL